MPLINYSVLRDLVQEFDSLTSHPYTAPEAQRRLEDVQYTMCVYTGHRDPHEAMAKARALLSRAEASRG